MGANLLPNIASEDASKLNSRGVGSGSEYPTDTTGSNQSATTATASDCSLGAQIVIPSRTS